MGNNYYISAMSYPNKYCNNCNKVTERYATGHCKDCVIKRSTASNNKRKAYNKDQTIYQSFGKMRQEKFNKDSYSHLTVEAVISELASGKQYFIYFLLKNNRVVYIGQSNNNVLGRISSHLKDKDFDEVYYKSFSVENVMDEYEKRFILKYRPKLNKAMVHIGVRYDFFDLKKEETISWTIEEAAEHIGCAEESVRGLLQGHRKVLYKRYVLESNKPEHSNFKSVLDTHTGEIKRHNYITFAEEAGVSQNAVWYFMNGIAKSFQKKRYVLVKNG